jgi:PAS domain S-box-containing protein
MRVKPVWSVLRGYAIAGLLVLVALAAGFMAGPDAEVQLAPLLFIAAGVLAAWFAGPGPGLAAVLLSVMLVEYCWVEPRFSLAIDPAQLPWFLTFILTGLLAMGLSLHRRRVEAELAESRDALEKRVAERTAQLHVSEERWRRLFETSSVGIAITEPDGHFLQVNRALQNMVGYSELALRQMTLADLIQEVILPDMPPGRLGGLESRAELPLCRQDGQQIWVSLSLSAIPAGDHSPPLASAVMIDVSARRRAIEDWRRAQIELGRVSRLTSLGVLAASIAHEVNQPLSAVVTNGEAAQRWMRGSPPNLAEAAAALDRMVRESNRAADIIRSIRQLLASTGGDREILSLHDVIRQLMPLIDNELTSLEVALTLDLAAPSALVSGDAVQLQQLLLNLMMNSLDSLRGVTGRRRHLRIATAERDGQLLLSIEDNGAGLDAGLEIEKLFEPFYTTKPRGMGVGLAICHHVVESHGGRIWAEPRQPHGAAFFFTLPLAAGDGTVESGRKADP